MGVLPDRSRRRLSARVPRRPRAHQNLSALLHDLCPLERRHASHHRGHSLVHALARSGFVVPDGRRALGLLRRIDVRAALGPVLLHAHHHRRRGRLCSSQDRGSGRKELHRAHALWSGRYGRRVGYCEPLLVCLDFDVGRHHRFGYAHARKFCHDDVGSPRGHTRVLCAHRLATVRHESSADRRRHARHPRAGTRTERDSP